MERAALLDRLRASLATQTVPIAAAWLFGSQARGDARADSDIDVAVLLPNHGADAYDRLMASFDIAASLERHLDRNVDVVVLDDVGPDLVHRVLRDGILVCEGDKAARIAFEVRARNEYFDMVPFLRRYRGTTGVEP